MLINVNAIPVDGRCTKVTK